MFYFHSIWTYHVSVPCSLLAWKARNTRYLKTGNIWYIRSTLEHLGTASTESSETCETEGLKSSLCSRNQRYKLLLQFYFRGFAYKDGLLALRVKYYCFTACCKIEIDHITSNKRQGINPYATVEISATPVLLLSVLPCSMWTAEVHQAASLGLRLSPSKSMKLYLWICMNVVKNKLKRKEAG